MSALILSEVPQIKTNITTFTAECYYFQQKYLTLPDIKCAKIIPLGVQWLVTGALHYVQLLQGQICIPLVPKDVNKM